MKTKILSKSHVSERPYEHLLPLTDYISKKGNEFRKGTSGFYLTQGGWVCDFQDEICYFDIQENFKLPETIRFGQKDNSVLCDLSWIEIRGKID